jgi:hypothetical protein
MYPPVGKSGPLDELFQLADRRVWIVDQMHDRADDLAQIVRWDVRRHTHGDARRPVDHKVRDAGGKNRRLLERVIEVRDEPNGVLLDVRQHFHRDRHQPRFGVAVRGRRIALDRAEVALAVDERISQ